MPHSFSLLGGFLAIFLCFFFVSVKCAWLFGDSNKFRLNNLIVAAETRVPKKTLTAAERANAMAQNQKLFQASLFSVFLFFSGGKWAQIKYAKRRSELYDVWLCTTQKSPNSPTPPYPLATFLLSYTNIRKRQNFYFKFKLTFWLARRQAKGHSVK